MAEDKDNFQFTIGKWQVVMSNGELTIDNVMYERNEDDPTYDLVIALWERLD